MHKNYSYLLVLIFIVCSCKQTDFSGSDSSGNSGKVPRSNEFTVVIETETIELNRQVYINTKLDFNLDQITQEKISYENFVYEDPTTTFGESILDNSSKNHMTYKVDQKDRIGQTDSIQITGLRELKGKTVIVEISISILILNRKPSVPSISIDIPTNTNIKQQLSGSDPDGHSLTFTPDLEKSTGIEIISFDQDSNELNITPVKDYTGLIKISYFASDGFDQSQPGILSFNIVETKPESQTVTITERTDAYFYKKVNIDSLATYEFDETMTFEIVQPAQYGITDSFNAANARFSYKANEASFIGKQDYIEVRGKTTDELKIMTIKVTLDIKNAKPTLQNISLSASKGQTINVPLKGNDLDQHDLSYSFEEASEISGIQNINYNSGEDQAQIVLSENFIGHLSFEYQASDGIDTSDPATISITVVDHYVGPKDGIVGYYTNENWGRLIIRIDEDNNFRATYDYRVGTVLGKYNPETGLVTGWWCEIPGSSKTRSHRGPAEFRFIFTDASRDIDKLNLKGKWSNYHTPNKWYYDWDLQKKANQTPPKILQDRFNDESAFCPRPQ